MTLPSSSSEKVPPSPTASGAGTPPRPRVRASAECGDDVFGEDLELSFGLVDRHQALVEEPGEPFQLAVVAVDGGQVLDVAFDVVDSADQAVLGLSEPFHGPLLGGQQGALGVSLLVAGQP